MKLRSLILLVFLCMACGKSTLQEKPEPFASISYAVEKEIEKRQASDKDVSKVLIINGSSDTQTIKADRWQADSNFWEKEFAVFNSFEAKPSWSRSFTHKRSEPVNAIIRDVYESSDEKIPLKKIELIKNSDSILSYVKLFLRDEKDLYQSEREVELVPGGYLRVSTYRKSVVNKPEKVEYLVFFNDK